MLIWFLPVFLIFLAIGLPIVFGLVAAPGILLYLDGQDKAINLLSKKEYIFDIMPVVALELENKPGELAKISTKFGKEGININYVYGSASSHEKKYLFVFCPEDIDLASKIFKT